MSRSIQIGTFLQLFALSLLSVFIFSPARGEDVDKTGQTLAEARVKYEEKMQATRSDALKKIDDEIDKCRNKSNPGEKEEKEIDVLKNAKSAFSNSGRWPSFKNIKDYQTKARNARNDLEQALEKARKDYFKASLDDAAKAVKAEREQFLKESDIVPWGDNLVAGREGEQRTIGAAHQQFDLGEFASKNYRLEIVAQRLEGDGPLTLEMPVPGKKRIEIKTIPGSEPELRVLLSVRESLISADLGIPRPVSTNFKIDDSPGKFELWADQGKFEVKSVRLKPILAEVADEIAQKKNPSPKQNPPQGRSNVEPATNNVDPASQLTMKSNWRGGRLNGQNDNNLAPEPGDAKVTMRNGNQVEITTGKWAGNHGHVHYLLTIDAG